MERTSHLSLTQAEKEAQQTIEVQKRLRGLIQKYMDGASDIEQLKADWSTLARNPGDDRLLGEGLRDRLALGQDNRLILFALERLCGLETSALTVLFENYTAALNRAATERRRELVAELARRRGFSGSALVPNLETDADWLRREQEIRREAEKRLERAKAKDS